MNADVEKWYQEVMTDAGGLQGGLTQLLSDMRSLHDAMIAADNPPVSVVLPPHSEGIDVSHWQGSIDWQKVKASGKSFAFIKASEGSNIIDSLFVINWRNAKAAGIMRGAYHFYRFADNPIVQANLFMMQMGNDLGELLPVVDVEEDKTGINLPTTVKMFCERVLAATGRHCIIYTGAWWWTAQRLGGPQTWVKDYPLWTAAYTPKPIVPQDWPAWAFWQYSNRGNVPGISVPVDLDVSA